MTIKNCSILVLALPAWIFTTHVHALGTNDLSTNSTAGSLANLPLMVEIEARTPVEHETFLQEFHRQMRDRTAFLDAFGPQTALGWVRQLDHSGYGIHDKIANKGRDVFESIALDSLRETAADRLPFDDWESKWTKLWYATWLGQLLQGTIGNTREEHLTFASATPNASDIEQAAELSTPREHNRYDYGFRSFSTFYTEADIGKWSKTQPLIHLGAQVSLVTSWNALTDGRAIRLASQMMLPLPYDCQFVAGGEMYAASDLRPTCSVRLQHLIFGDRLRGEGGFAYVGSQFNEQERRISTGLSISWNTFTGWLRR